MLDAHLLELSKYRYAERGSQDPYGVDCWEFVMTYYDLVLGIKLEDFLAIYEPDSPYAPLDAALAKAPDFGWRKVDEPQVHDVIVTQFNDLRTHAGVVVATFPTIRVIHVPVNGRAIIQAINEGSWQERLIGFYRHAEVK